MRNIRSGILSTLLILSCIGLNAQPPRRQQEQQQQQSATAVTLSERAKAQYTGQTGTPTEVAWKRDIYRELDLKKEKNAALYYPEEPLGDRVNFFTLVFNLILDGKVKAYEYRLDGNESFTADNVLDIENMLDKFYIYYEKKDGKYVVQQTDIPSSEVMKYFIKESNYLDMRTSDYQTRVTAICPVLVRDDFGNGSATNYPMFWLDYDEISPYLGQAQVMTSSYNNTSNMSLDDYFVMHQYRGDIYKTANLRNQPIAEYCENDSLIKIEQQRIENQLIDFEKGLWGASEEKKVSNSVAAKAAVNETKVTANETKASVNETNKVVQETSETATSNDVVEESEGTKKSTISLSRNTVKDPKAAKTEKTKAAKETKAATETKAQKTSNQTKQRVSVNRSNRYEDFW